MTLDDLLNFDDWAMEHLPGILAWPIQFIWFIWTLIVLISILLIIALAAPFIPPNKFKRWWRDHT